MKTRTRATAHPSDAPLAVERRLEALRTLLADPDRPIDSSGPLLLGVGEAARLLGVSRSTLWRMTRLKKLIPVEIMPGTFRIRRRDIERIAGAEQ